MADQPYDPERSLDELRRARREGDPSYQQISQIMEQAARNAAELWTDPHDRERAGLGAVVAAATLAPFAQPGRDAPMLNCVGYFGLALVDHARAEMAVEGG